MNSQDVSRLSAAKRSLLEQRLSGQEGARAHTLLVANNSSGPAPLSSAQEQLWYYSQLAPDNPVYNEAVTIRKDGPFDAGAFAQAFNELISRHQSWRSTFALVDGRPMLIPGEPTVFELPVTDLQHMAPDQREHAAAMLAVEDSRRPYDLANGPLMRPRLVRFDEGHHRLYLSMHHLIFDGVTLYRIVLPELIALYDAAASGRASPLAAPAIQYADYARWEQESFGAGAAEERMNYWRRRLADSPTLELPLDHPRPIRQRFRGGMEAIHIPKPLADRLRTVGRDSGSSLFQVIASAFAVLLHRYSGQDDVVFGTVTDLRRRTELDGLVGYCLTPQVLRADFSDDPTFTALLAQVRVDLLDGLDHQVPFGRLVRELNPRREPGANPIFQAMVVLEPPMVVADPAWSIHQMELEVGNALGHAKLDLHIELDERPEGHVAGRLIYNADVFEASTARRAVGHWHSLLGSVAADPAQCVSTLAILTTAEERQLLVEWNSTAAEYPRHSPVHDLVTAQVARTPDAVAVVCGDYRLTFSELDERANDIARALEHAGAGRGTVVAICVERSSEMIAGLLGILKSGAAYLPLDPRHPVARLARTIEDSGATVVLTQDDVVDRLPAQGVRVVRLEAVAHSAPDPTRISSTDAATADDLAYVMYTSGSSGLPKGVRIRHRSVVNLLCSLAHEPGISSRDTVLAITTSSFDMSVPDLWLPLVTGARMVVAPHDVARDGRQLIRLITEAKPTFMQATPATWQMLVESGWAGDPELVALSGGDTLGPDLAQWLVGHTRALWNAYGPTETTVWSALGRLHAGDRITIGRPIANTSIRVLDKQRHIVPVGVAGEVYIGGDGVAAGYLNRADLTVERFVDDPLDSGARMYRTGDRARYGVDGRLEYMGRLDDQIKVRGFRVEPGEIEAALLSHPHVASAVVVAQPGAQGLSRLVGYFVAKGESTSGAELRAHLRTWLPEHMVPSAFVPLDALPLSANGKVDRNALPEPDLEDRASHAGVAPRTDAEQRVATIWSRVLNVTRVGVDDDFFEAGGHSLLAVRLLVEVEKEFGVEVPLTTFFEGNATVAGLATAVEGGPADHPRDRLTVPLQSLGTTPTLFFIHADESSMLTLRHFIGPLGAEQRVVGLLPERVGRRFDRSRSIEELATPMLETIRRSQPDGPYFLAGYSLGGLIAYEIAGRLHAAGLQVGWLGVLDAGTPAAGARYQQQRLSVRQRVARQRERGAQGAMRKTFEVARRELKAALVRLRLRRSEMSDEFDWRGARALSSRYACPPNEVAMDLFVTAERAAGAGSETLGWSELHKGVLTVHRFEGDHRAMVTEPRVREVATEVARSLREAMSASPAH